MTQANINTGASASAPDGEEQHIPASKAVAEYILHRAAGASSSETGNLIPHEELLYITGFEEAGPRYYGIMSATSKYLERQHNRSLQVVKGEGYLLIAGTAQVNKGRRQQARAARSARRALDIVRTADDTVMTSDERTLKAQVTRGMAAITQIIGMQAERLAAHDRELAALRDARAEDIRTTAEEIADIRVRLARIEAGDEQPGS